MTAKRINPLSTDVMSVAEAARRCQISPTTVKKGIVNGTFPGHKVEGRFLIPRRWFDLWLEGRWTATEQADERIPA